MRIAASWRKAALAVCVAAVSLASVQKVDADGPQPDKSTYTQLKISSRPAIPQASPFIVPWESRLTPSIKRQLNTFIASLPESAAGRLIQASNDATNSSFYRVAAQNYSRPVANAAFFAEWKQRLTNADAAASRDLQSALTNENTSLQIAQAGFKTAQATLREAKAKTPVEKRRLRVHRHHRHWRYAYVTTHQMTPELAAAQAHLQVARTAAKTEQARYDNISDAVTGIRNETDNLQFIANLAAGGNADMRFMAQKTLAQPFADVADQATGQFYADKETGRSYSYGTTDAAAYAALTKASKEAQADKSLFYSEFKLNAVRASVPRHISVVPSADKIVTIKTTQSELQRVFSVCKQEWAKNSLPKERLLRGEQACVGVRLNRGALPEVFGSGLDMTAKQYEAVKKHGRAALTLKLTPEEEAADMAVVKGQVYDPTFGGALYFQNTSIDKRRRTDFGRAYAKIGTVGDPRSGYFHDFYNAYKSGKIYQVPLYIVTIVPSPHYGASYADARRPINRLTHTAALNPRA